jgi:hypothetical protein
MALQWYGEDAALRSHELDRKRWIFAVSIGGPEAVMQGMSVVVVVV